MGKIKLNYVYIVFEYDVLGQLTSFVVFSKKSDAEEYHTIRCFENEYSTCFVQKVIVL